MTESDRESTQGPFPPVPAGGARQGRGETEDMAPDELGATVISGKTKPEPEPEVDQDFDNLDSTIVNVKIQQIPGLKLVKELGRGAAGVVYRGKQEFLDREVAVKMLLEQRKNPEYSARFKREAKLLAGLQHAHIVSCYQADVTPDGVCFLVMEFVDGPNLREYLVENGPLDLLDALRVCRDLAAALACAHEKNIIHRDVKSENVLLASEPRAPQAAKFRYRAKLSDLGLARPQGKSLDTGTSLHLTVGATIMGTPLNMSPEQFDDPQGVDHRTDIYSLGCVLYDMLTAKAPFKERTLSTLVVAKHNALRGPDPRADREGIEPDVAELVRRMLAAKREDRPQTYAELIAECEGLIARFGGGAAPRAERNPAAMIATIAVATLLGGVGIWWAVAKHAGGAQGPPVAELALLIEPVTNAKEGQLVTLTATPSGGDGSIPVLTWEQIDEVKRVPLSANNMQATFTAPRSIEPYELSFRVSGIAGPKSAVSKIVKVAVEAHDDPPTVEISGPTESKENESIKLSATIDDPDGHGAQSFEWKAADASLGLEFDKRANPLVLKLPERSKPYDVDLALDAQAGSKTVSKHHLIHVAAENALPEVSAKVPPPAMEGTQVALEAEARDVDSQSDLRFGWKQLQPAAPLVTFADARALVTSFIAPDCLQGDYDLALELTATDGDRAVKHQVAVKVTVDPGRKPLTDKAPHSWISRIPENSSALAGWNQGAAPLDLKDIPEEGGGFSATSTEAGGSITHPLPHGSFQLEVELLVSGILPKCGLQLFYGDQSALSLCLVREKNDDRRFVSFTSSKSGDGTWSEPGESTLNFLGLWPNEQPLKLELTWNGQVLNLRWWNPAQKVWTEPSSFPLSAPPRAAALFMKQRGRMNVVNVSIRGV